MTKVKTGVIGVGMMGQRHCRVYSTLRQTDLIGVCDANSTLGENVAQQYGVPYFTDLDDLLEQVDAVSLVTPTPYHFELTKRCIERGKHILVEKPLTETVTQAEEIVRLAADSDLIVQVGHIERFNTAYIELKNVLKDMTILAINLRRLSAFESSNKDVNVVLDLMIHDSDLALDLMGARPTTLNAHGLSVLSNVVDHASAYMNFEQGTLLTMTASRVTEQKIRLIEVTALEAYLECDLLNKKVLVHRRTSGQYLNHSGKYRHESFIESIHVPVVEPLHLELEHFVNCIISGQTPQVTAADGLAALQLVNDIQTAMQPSLKKIEHRATVS